MRILITGGAGFIGSHVAFEYFKKGYEVAIVDEKEELHLPKDLLGNVTYFQADITSPDIARVFTVFKPQVVNHHAAKINVEESFNKPATYSKTNMFGTVKLLELCNLHSVSQFIFASSVAVYGDTEHLPIKESEGLNPKSLYGLNKYCAEKYIGFLSNRMTTTIFRYANVYGPRQNSSAEGGVVAIFAQKLAVEEPITIYGDGKQTRDFVYVKDVARANVLATEKEARGTIHISTCKETSANDLLAKMVGIAKVKPIVTYKPSREGDIRKSVLDNSKAKRCLSWKPDYSLNQGLQETLNYFSNL
mgnify:CR=1 FL=1